jgi:hypothetical protein
MSRGLLLFSVVFFCGSAMARSFQNSYVKFNLPDTWACNQEGPAWVCAPANSGDAREALIITTAKLTGPEDSLNSFYNYLRQPKTLVSRGSSSLSQPLSIEKKKLSGLDWIQAVHIGSEVPNFTTRYLATVKDKFSILISFSSDRDFDAKYKPIFDTAIRTLRLDTSKPLLMRPVIDESNNRSFIGGHAPALPPSPVMQQEAPAARQKKMWLFGLIAVAAVGVLFAIRKLV